MSTNVSEPIIELDNLRRSFLVRQKSGRLRRTTRTVHAVDGITASVQAGEAVGYIGANGAGKSTTRGEVAAALVHQPRLLVLDEPTIGLDMISKERLRHFLVAERRERGTTLLLTTHD